MTEQVLFEKLSKIYENIDKEKYKEISNIIDYYVLNQENLLSNAFELATMLHNADKVDILPKQVSEFLFEVYFEEIKNNNARAMTNIGALFYTGRCGEQNYIKAIKYYKTADKLGEPQATENLGYCYYYGRNGKIDYKKAYHFFIKGALKERLNSLYKIGDMYKNGYYVKKDENLAFNIYNQCYNKLNRFLEDEIGANICMRMGDAYYYGIGTIRDYKSALEFYQKAERYFYKKINEGDFFATNDLEIVVAKQEKIRQMLLKELPSFDWKNKKHSD